MSANFVPALGIRNNPPTFRFWCQKVLPLVYDDSLSYYELLCKVVNYLNNTIEDVKTLGGDVDNLLTAYKELEDYVNTYFDNLDIKKELTEILGDSVENILERISTNETNITTNEKNIEINANNITANEEKINANTDNINNLVKSFNTIAPWVRNNVGMHFTDTSVIIETPNSTQQSIYYVEDTSIKGWTRSDIVSRLKEASKETVVEAPPENANWVRIQIPANTALCYNTSTHTLNVLAVINSDLWSNTYIVLVQRSTNKIVGGVWFDRYNYTSDISNLKDGVSTTQTQIEILKETVMSHNDEINELNSNIGSVQNTANDNTSHISTLQQDVANNREEIGNTDTRIDNVVEKSNTVLPIVTSQIIIKNTYDGSGGWLMFDADTKQDITLFDYAYNPVLLTDEKIIKLLTPLYARYITLNNVLPALQFGTEPNKIYTYKPPTPETAEQYPDGVIDAISYERGADNIYKPLLITDSNNEICGGSWYGYYLKGVIFNSEEAMNNDINNFNSEIIALRNSLANTDNRTFTNAISLARYPVPLLMNNNDVTINPKKENIIFHRTSEDFVVEVRLKGVSGYDYYLKGRNYTTPVKNLSHIFDTVTSNTTELEYYACTLRNLEYVIFERETNTLVKKIIADNDDFILPNNGYALFANFYGFIEGSWSSIGEYDS